MTIQAQTAVRASSVQVKNALGHVRTATQELHGAISDAVVKTGGATKADLEAFSQKIKAATEAAKSSIGPQQEAAKKKLSEAVTQLETAQKHVSEALKATGEKAETSVRQALVNARASAQKISEAVAAARAAVNKSK
jgi:polyhydroxyalkanoate synthesis regulator phasin